MMEDYSFTDYFLKEKKSKSAFKLFAKFMYALLIFYAILLTVSFFFHKEYRYITIQGPSMQPTLNPDPIYVDGVEHQDGVYIKLNNSEEDLADIDYGDIVIVDRSEEKGEEGYTVIKRVIGFEGDKLSIVKLPVGENGEYEMRVLRIKEGTGVIECLEEDYVKSYEEWGQYTVLYDEIEYDDMFFYHIMFANQTEIYPYYIDGQRFDVHFFTIGSDKMPSEPDQIFIMGDNRINSQDSRETGTSDVDKIVGKVVRIVHNSYSLRNSLFGWLENICDFLSIIWEEIVNLFR